MLSQCYPAFFKCINSGNFKLNHLIYGVDCLGISHLVLGFFFFFSTAMLLLTPFPLSLSRYYYPAKRLNSQAKVLIHYTIFSWDNPESRSLSLKPNIFLAPRSLPLAITLDLHCCYLTFILFKYNNDL